MLYVPMSRVKHSTTERLRSLCRLKNLIWRTGDPPVQWSGTIYVKLYNIWTSGSGDVV